MSQFILQYYFLVSGKITKSEVFSVSNKTVGRQYTHRVERIRILEYQSDVINELLNVSVALRLCRF